MQSPKARRGRPDLFSSAKTAAPIPARHPALREALAIASLDPEVSAISYVATANVGPAQVDVGAVVLTQLDGRHYLDVVPARRVRSLDEEGLALIALRELGLQQLVITAEDLRADPKLHAFKLRNLRVIDPISFTRAVRRHLMIDEPAVEEWIGPAEAAEVLKITYAFFWRLARARPDLIPRRREGSAPYLLADVQSLAETYIFVSEIAFRRDLHPRLVVGWLRTMGVEAEFSVRKKQDLAFLRGQVEPVLERWNLKDDAPARRAATEISASKPLTEHT